MWTKLWQHLLLQPCSLPWFSSPGLLTYLWQCPSLIMFIISFHTTSLALMKRNSQLCQHVLWFCDVKKKKKIPYRTYFTCNQKLQDFDLRSLEVEGLHQLSANQAPKWSTFMKLEHNKCFLWVEPAALKFLSSSDLLQSWVFQALRGGEVREARITSLPLPGISEVVWLFQMWLLMSQNKGFDQPRTWGGTDPNLCFTTGLYQHYRAYVNHRTGSLTEEDGTWMGICRRGCVYVCRHKKGGTRRVQSWHFYN